ncbi:MAG: hypothetical protein GF344_12735 [Chitinivibrionales bacterium]|nr:hypothetical protein [Chitinivibrionales bacterium]MBD3357609.1 hypothetical protein [Chitinivibrionales bacterium]
MWNTEHGLKDAGDTSPAETRPYVVNINDRSGGYLDVTFQVDLPLPYRGVYLSKHQSSPSAFAPKGLHLYSSPLRGVPGWMASIRGELMDVSTGRPASWALLRVTAEAGETYYGIADKEGRYCIMFGYPVLIEGFGGSPSSLGNRPLNRQSWELTMELFYSPGTRVSLPGGKAPDYLSILRQQTAFVWTQKPGSGVSPVAALPLRLEFGKRIIVRTEGESNLLISQD